MKITLWGCRGSLPAPGTETVRYGGNTSCIQLQSGEHVLVLDAGSGACRLGSVLTQSPRRIDLFLTHLHMDHIIGLGFFAPTRIPGVEMHIWGPASTTLSLRQRLNRYLSPPLFPVYLRDMPSVVQLHEVPSGTVEVGPFTVSSSFVCHPDPTVGYRVECGGRTLTYLPDHEPRLGVKGEWPAPGWISGFELARDCDLLVHDAQYAPEEYNDRVGWGHSSIEDTFGFAAITGAKRLVPFHHDPTHSDDLLDRLIGETVESRDWPFEVLPGKEDMIIEIA